MLGLLSQMPPPWGLVVGWLWLQKLISDSSESWKVWDQGISRFTSQRTHCLINSCLPSFPSEGMSLGLLHKDTNLIYEGFAYIIQSPPKDIAPNVSHHSGVCVRIRTYGWRGKISIYIITAMIHPLVLQQATSSPSWLPYLALTWL